MKTISYANGVWSIMYEMMCSKSNLAHVNVVSKFTSDLGDFEVCAEIVK